MTQYTSDEIRSATSFLFVPGDRPERFEKAAASGSDVVVIDLEDAVAPADKEQARENARVWLHAGSPAMIRINGADTPWHEGDLTLSADGMTAVMLPKAGPVGELWRFDPSTLVVALVETAAGIAGLSELCVAPGVHRLAFGSIDFGAQLGIDPTDREALLTARSLLVIASAANGLAPPIDGVTTALTDREMIINDVVYARRLGLTGKLCIHPAQVAAAHEAAAPTQSEAEWATKVLASASANGSASAVDGQMVDLPVLQRARDILAALSRV
ncbi:CoA ester lyase [Mycobacterium sp. SMC-8]|uniref:HpcH/HpaI aldolase/citrate lyase family protein n=1 Tax=Mycobacterium sp. SMC-8 TaxID=2857060 RepID=UPI0021B30EFE|nr:CoA ester lyase [Mycobacterium sp. SMC-8]UXA11458.1 CoA ester lyase [Mycobacterium sp. SMC-8]